MDLQDRLHCSPVYCHAYRCQLAWSGPGGAGSGSCDDGVLSDTQPAILLCRGSVYYSVGSRDSSVVLLVSCGM